MAAYPWKRVLPTGDLTVTAGQIPDDWLGHLNTAITANSGASDASWEVATYSTATPKYLLLRRKDGSAGRIAIFGQNATTPNTLSARVGTASLLYIGFSGGSNSNTADANWNTGQILSASDYMRAHATWQMAAGTTWRLTYFDSYFGMYFAVTVGTTTGMALAGAGMLLEGNDTQAYPTILGYGNQSLTSTPWAASNSSIISPIVATNVSVNTAPRLIARVNGIDESLWRIFKPCGTTESTGKLKDTTNNRAYFFPIQLVHGLTDMRLAAFGKMRQVAFGPNDLKESQLAQTGSPTSYAYGHGHDNATPNPCIWFTQFEV